MSLHPVQPACRVASLVPSLTETVCDLGVGGRLVACTDYCCDPRDVIRFVPRIGTTKKLDREKLLGLEPDLVLANREENRTEDIDWIAARVPVYASLPQNVPDAGHVVREIGRRLDVLDAAEAFLLEIEAQVVRAEIEALQLGGVRVFYPIWRKPWVSVGRDSYVHDVLTRAGAINVCADRTGRYPSLEEHELRALRPDVVLLPGAPFAFREEHREMIQQRELFGPGVAVRLVDGRDFCWHGTRTGAGLGRACEVLRAYRRRRRARGA